MKREYLVVIFTKTYLRDFIIVYAESPLGAMELAKTLEKVISVVSVWKKAE